MIRHRCTEALTSRRDVLIAGSAVVAAATVSGATTLAAEDLKKFDVATLIVHGDDDQIVPIGASAQLSAKIVKGATLKVYPGAPHGLATTHKDQLNADLQAFIKA